MNGNGIGSALVIDDAFLAKLDKVDEKIARIQTTAENTAKGFARSFTDMDSFAIGLENSLSEVVNRLKSINSSSQSASNAFTQNFKQMDASAIGIENSLSEVVNRLKDVQTTAKSVGQSLQNANSVQTLLNGIGSVSSAVTQLTDQINKMIASLQNAGNSVTGGGGGGMTGGITTATVSVQQLLQEVNKVIAAMQQTGTAGASGIMRAKMAIDNFVAATQNVTLGNIAQLENQIRSIETTLTDKSKNLSQLAQKQLVERKRLLEEEVKYQRQTYQEQQVMTQSLYDRLLREQQKYQREQEKAAQEAARRQNTTYSGAMNFAANASSINERTKAIQYLTEARNNLSTSTANYEQKLAALNSKINGLNAANSEATSGAKKLGSEYNSLEGVLVRCAKRFSALYTLNTIKQFGQEIIKVRGNMELQQKSLESILQNKTEADTIFNKTLSLATQSPFKIQDLTTYVKQLASYRIESDKLFDTTKRLADVSAGLGVDMQRLILAYGQVKAAAYLRGSEVRQFTEAGVNMYGELQSYFKEVKGEAYTTAQIADMISKRMVTFKDVEEVFKRITDSGGIFYNMQETQSATIYGKVQKLSDALDIMYNQIGKTHEGSIKNTLDLAMKLINSWETIGNLIEAAIFSLVLMKSSFLQCHFASTKLGAGINFISNGIANAAKSIKFTEKAAVAMGKAVNTALSGVAIMAISEALKYVAYSIYDYNKAINEANTALAKELGTIYDISYAFDKLKKQEAEIKTKDDIEKNIADRRAQLQKLIDTADKSGLTFTIDVEEIDAQKIDSTFSTIKKKYEQFAEDIRMTKRNLAQNASWNTWFTDGLNDYMGDYDSAVNSFLADAAKIDTAISNMKAKSDKAGPFLKKYFDELYQGQKDGESRLDYYSRMVELLTKISDLGGRAQFSSGLGDAGSELDKVRSKAADLNAEFDAVLGSSIGVASSMMDKSADISSAITEAKNLGSDYNTILSSLNAKNKEWGKTFADNIKTMRDGKKDNEDELSFFLRMAEAIKNIQEVSAKGGFTIFKGLDVQSIIDDLNDFKAKYGDTSTMQVKATIDRIAAENDWSQYAKELAQKRFGVYLNISKENTEKEINWVDNYIDKFFAKKKYGINLVVKEIDAKDAFSDFVKKGDNLAKAAKNWREVEERLAAVAKETQNIDVDNSILAILKNAPTVKQYKLGDMISVKEVQSYVKKYKEAATESAKALGVNPFEKEDKKAAAKAAKAQRDIIQERIDLLTRMQKKYEELLKYMSSKNAAETTLYYFSDTSKYVGLQLAKDFVPTKDNIIKQLEKQLGNINPKEITKIAGLKQKIADLRFGITVDKDKETLDAVKKDIELIFANLKVNVKLKDLGFSQEEISSMFPKLETSLANVTQSVEKLFLEKFGDKATWGKDIQKQFDEVSKRIQKQELDDSFNTFTQLTKNYKAQLSDQLQLDRWYMEERLKIQTNPQLAANQDLRSQYLDNLQTKYGQKSSENKWKAFQNSDLYLSVFGNLEVQSNRVLAYIKERLNSLKDEMKNLDPTNLKAISEQISKIDELQTSRNPFKNINSGIKSYIKFAKQRKSLEQDYIRNLTTIDELNQSIGSENRNMVNLEQQYQEEVAQNGNETERAKSIKEQIKQKKQLIKTEIEHKKKLEDTANIQNNTIEDGIQNQEKMKKTATEVANVFSAVASNLGSLINSLGGNVGGDLETTLNMLDNIGQAVGNYFSGNYAGMVSNAIGIIGEMSTLISGDNRRQEAIESLQTEVKILEKAYDRLIKKRDEAINAYDVIGYSDDAVENTKATIRKYQAMIAEERDKKNVDENAIREWEDKITDYEDRLQELMLEQRRAFGGIGEDEYKDAAQAFADAWIDAFNSSEDALDALTDKMDEYLTNMLKKQAMNRLVGNALKPVFKLIDEITSEGSEGGNNGTDVTSKEFERLRELSSSTLEVLNKQMSDMMNVMGWTGTSSTNLSSLQQGIQNVTETTAEALEAMLNSMRFMLSGQSQNIAAIKDIIVQALGSSSDNPVLSELKQQTTLLRAINSTFGDVVKAGHPNGGYGLKVFMNK